MTDTLAPIEAQMIAAIKAAVSTTVEVRDYPASELSSEGIAQHSVSPPSALLARIAAVDPELQPNGQLGFEFRWGVYCIAHALHPQGETCFEIAQAVLLALHNKRFGPPHNEGNAVGLVRVLRCESLTTDASVREHAFEVWGITIGLKVQIGEPEFAEFGTTEADEFDIELNPQ